MNKRIFVSVLLCIGFVGCASPRVEPVKPSPEEQAAADYGAYPEKYEQIVKEYMQGKLKDPESARFRFQGKPRKSYNTVYEKSALQYYYTVEADINAKNSYGGYVGEHKYLFHIRNDRVVDSYDFTKSGEDIDRYLARPR